MNKYLPYRKWYKGDQFERRATPNGMPYWYNISDEGWEARTGQSSVKRIPRKQWSPKYFVGVEFEGMIRSSVRKKFVRSLLALSEDQNGENRIVIGSDGSIEDVPRGFGSVEFRTTTLPLTEGLTLTEDIFCFLFAASQTEDWLTNETCGLHVNISERSIFESERQVKLYAHLIKNFDETTLLERFGRTDNDFCQPFYVDDGPKTLESIERLYLSKWEDQHDKKYFSVALRDSPAHAGYDGPKVKNCRVEFRGMGNTDYHLKINEVKKSVNEIVAAFKMSCREIARS